MINIQNLRHVAMVVNDLEVMLDFYTSILGFKLERSVDIESREFREGIDIQDARAKIAHLEIPHSDVRLEMFEFAEKRHSPDTHSAADLPGYRHIAFIVDDIEKSCAHLKEQGLEFSSEPITLTEPGEDLRFVYFKDPEGNIIELNDTV